ACSARTCAASREQGGVEIRAARARRDQPACQLADGEAARARREAGEIAEALVAEGVVADRAPLRGRGEPLDDRLLHRVAAEHTTAPVARGDREPARIAAEAAARLVELAPDRRLLVLRGGIGAPEIDRVD